MAIQFDNASTATGAAANSVQWTHTATGSNVYAILCGVNDSVSISAAGYNGVTMTAKAFVVATGGAGGKLFEAQNAAAGNVTISAVLNGAGTDAFVFGAMTYTGVAQSGASGNAASATGAAATLHQISLSATANALMIGFLGGRSITALTVTTPLGQNARFEVSNSPHFLTGCDKTATGSSSSMSWSTSGAIAFFKLAIAVSATAIAAGSATPFCLPMLGVGK